jgi:hypothetical protein
LYVPYIRLDCFDDSISIIKWYIYL